MVTDCRYPRGEGLARRSHVLGSQEESHKLGCHSERGEESAFLCRLKLRLQECVRSTKMVDNSLVFCDEVTIGTNALALRGQAAVAEEAALHTGL